VSGKARICAAWLLLAALGGLAAQDGGSDAPPSGQDQGAESGAAGTRPKPQEYGEEEFSPFLKALRRGEIVMLGSLPFSLFFTLEVYDTYRWIDHDFDSEFTPWPFRRPGAASYTKQESIGVFVSALTVSCLIAVADFVFGKLRERSAEGRPGTD
jgi:hypothetical protein